MSNTTSGYQEVDEVTVTDEQRAKACSIVQKHPGSGHVRALRAAGVKGTRGQISAHVEADEDLREDLLHAAHHVIRDEIRRRAIEGVEEPVFHNGEIVGYVRKYSDRLLEMLGRMNLPEARALLAARVGVEVTGEVRTPDIADAVNRLNDLVSSAAVRLTAAAGAGGEAGVVDGRGESRPRVPVAQLDRPA